MGVDSLRLYVQRITDLPTIPVIAQKILKLVTDDMTSVGTLEHIIEQDPSISAKILSVSNSAFFGFKTPTSTISHAIVRIGFNNVKNIALGVSLMTVLNNGKQAPLLDYKRVFKHSVAVGIVAGKLSRELRVGIPEEIFINGILHDIGFLVLYRYFSGTYQQVMEKFSENSLLLDAEISVLEFTHAEIGAWLTDRWKLPESVFNSTRYHHAPSQAENNIDIVALIHLADYLTTQDLSSVTDKDPKYPFDEKALDTLGLSQKDMIELGSAMSDEMLPEGIF